MPVPTTEDRRGAANAGFFGHVAGFVGGVAEYIRLRLRLAGLEAKEAGIHYAIIAGLVAGAVVVLGFGYLFFCLALVFAIAALFPHHPHAWIWITFGMALLHFGAALVAILLARAKILMPMFTATLEEFKKDQQWLTSTIKK